MRVSIPSPLFSYTRGVREVEVPGRTVGEALGALDARFPGLRFRVVDEHGEIREHIRMWIGARLARGLADPVAEDDTLMIVAALSGG